MAPLDSVLWQEQVVLPELEHPQRPFDPDTRVDVVVVGAGYAGLGAAIEIAKADRSVLVLEKERIGWGAHSRNGGMAIPELKAGPETLKRRYGELGLRMHREVNEAFDHLESRIVADQIDCDYERTGQLYLAHSPRAVPYIRALASEHTGLGEPVRFVEREALADEIGSESFYGGVVYERTGALHPAKLHDALLRTALRDGAQVRDRCPALAISPRPGGSGFRVETSKGAVIASHVIVATNAYTDGVLPTLRRRVLPIGSYIIATERLSPELASELSPRNRMFVDTKNLLFYWRLTPDNRLLFGGRRTLGQTSLADAGEYLSASMRKIHPQLRDVEVTHRWGGNVAMTIDRMPHVGQIDGVWYGAGCNGSGVALNTWLGHRLGLMVLGQAGPPSFAELKHRPIPAFSLRRAYLPVVGKWFEWQDRP